jgi:hypothetical protein
MLDSNSPNIDGVFVGLSYNIQRVYKVAYIDYSLVVDWSLVGDA